MELGGSNIQLRGQGLRSIALTTPSTRLPSSGDKGGGGGKLIGLDGGDQRGVGEFLRSLGRRVCQQSEGPIHDGDVTIVNQVIDVGLSFLEGVILDVTLIFVV